MQQYRNNSEFLKTIRLANFLTRLQIRSIKQRLNAGKYFTVEQMEEIKNMDLCPDDVKYFIKLLRTTCKDSNGIHRLGNIFTERQENVIFDNDAVIKLSEFRKDNKTNKYIEVYTIDNGLNKIEFNTLKNKVILI